MSDSVADAAAVMRRKTVLRGPKSRRPWNDAAGRFSTIKAVLLAIAAAPLLWLAYAWPMGLLGARPGTEAIHVTGLWSVRFLLMSLLVTPLRAVSGWQRVTVVRRQLGLTALAFGLIHLVLFARDQGWVLTHASSEILQRFYLMMGLVALVGLSVLGVTSYDIAVRRMGRDWKRVQRAVYGLGVLVLFHYFLQSKADVSEPIVLAGVFVWLIGWRLLPAGPDRQPLPLLGLGLATAAVTLGLEYAWFALATRIDPARVLRAEADVSFGLHPAAQVLLLGLSAALVCTLLWARQRATLRDGRAFGVALYAGGAVIVAGVCFAFSLTDDWLPDSWSFWPAAGWFVAAAAIIGVIRFWLPGRTLLDGAVAAVLLVPLALGLTL